MTYLLYCKAHTWYKVQTVQKQTQSMVSSLPVPWPLCPRTVPAAVSRIYFQIQAPRLQIDMCVFIILNTNAIYILYTHRNTPFFSTRFISELHINACKAASSF